jgi:hypothetical protein
MGPTDGTGIQQLRPTTYSRDAGSGTKNMQGEKIRMVTKVQLGGGKQKFLENDPNAEKKPCKTSSKANSLG